MILFWKDANSKLLLKKKWVQNSMRAKNNKLLLLSILLLLLLILQSVSFRSLTTSVSSNAVAVIYDFFFIHSINLLPGTSSYGWSLSFNGQFITHTAVNNRVINKCRSHIYFPTLEARFPTLKARLRWRMWITLEGRKERDVALCWINIWAFFCRRI